MKKESFYKRLMIIRASLHECEAIMNDFLQGKRSQRCMPYTAEDDSDPVKVRKGITRAIVDIDRLTDEVEHE